MDDDIGGLGYCGAMGCGAPRMDGRVGNLRLRQGGIGDVSVDFIHDSEIGEGASFLVYQDGLLVGRTTPGQGWDTEPLGDGGHELAVVVVRSQDRCLPELGGVGREHGRRVWLGWERVGDADVAGYNVYWNAGSGAVSYGTPIGTVDRVEFGRRWADPPDSGTGTGRLSAAGEWTGTGNLNASWTVRIAGAGLLEVDTGAGYGDPIGFAQGTGIGVGQGLTVTMEDPPADYVTGDTWTIFVGPRNWWVSGELGAGTYTFDVLPIDAAGNEGTSGGTTAVVIAGEPDAPTEVSASWDGVHNRVDFTWTDSVTAGCTYRIYGNWEQIFGARLDAVNELAAMAEYAEGAEAGQVALAGFPGRMYFYVRAVSAGGVEERNANLLTVDCVEAAAASLAAPRVVRAEAIAGGKVRLTWVMDWSSGAPETVRVYAHTSATPDWSAAVAVDEFAWDTDGARWNVGSFTWESADAFVGPRWFTVRAADGDGNETDNTDVTGCVPDAAAPGELGGLVGFEV